MTPGERDRSPPTTEAGLDAKRAELLSALWERHHGTNAERVGALESAALALVDGDLSPSLREDAKTAAHKLAGSLGTFGFEEGTRIARTAEAQLEEDVPDAKRPVAMCRCAPGHPRRRGEGRRDRRGGAGAVRSPLPTSRPTRTSLPARALTSVCRNTSSGARSCWSPAIPSCWINYRSRPLRSAARCSAPGTHRSSTRCCARPASPPSWSISSFRPATAEH